MNFLSALPSGITSSSNLSFTSDFPTSLSKSDFELLAQLDSLTSQNVISDNFASGFTLSDSTDNIRSLITSTNTAVVAAKDFITAVASTSDEPANKLQLTWDEYLGALSGSSFDKDDSSTYATSASAFKDLSGDFELLVIGTASEIQNIINTYGTTISNLPTAVSFDITDGNALTLTQAQLDVLDARIEGVVQISDTSAGIASLLNNAIPSTVQSLTSTDTLKISFDQFRNLPNYYSGDVVLLDTEDNIVKALSEDLLDDRVTTCLLYTSPSPRD